MLSELFFVKSVGVPPLKSQEDIWLLELHWLAWHLFLALEDFLQAVQNLWYTTRHKRSKACKKRHVPCGVEMHRLTTPRRFQDGNPIIFGCRGCGFHQQQR